MELTLLVMPWVLGSVAVGLGIGFYLGRNSAAKAGHRSQQDKDEKNQANTLKVLSAVLSAAEQLNHDVGSHNLEIKEVGRQLVDLHVDGEMRDVQRTLLGEIATVLESNRRLEDDLNYAKLRIEEQAQEIDRTRKEARVDVLSGVGNRKAFDEKLMMMLAQYRREGRPFVLALCDIDHFKWINDTHGHAAGDNVVTQVGNFLMQSVRGDDFVARFGGDEFAILFAGATLKVGTEVSERIRLNVSRQNFGISKDSQEAAVTFSIGVAEAWIDARPEELLEHADQALYKSKQTGRNKVYAFDAQKEGVVAVTQV